MRSRIVTTCLAGVMAIGAGQPPQPVPPIVTAIPFETLRRCFETQWARTGRITAINTAAGAMLDLSFSTVEDDGKVGTGHAIFSIEDRGVERRVTASAGDPDDAPLARQMLDQTLAGCASETAKR